MCSTQKKDELQKYMLYMGENINSAYIAYKYTFRGFYCVYIEIARAVQCGN